ncbi:putative transposase [Trichonephila clavipes]|nr:putative transposase [Trichonephila clavipes]
MEIPLRTAYGQAGRCGMQPKAKPSSLRAQAHQMKQVFLVCSKMSDNEQRCAIKFCFRHEHNATVTFAKFQQAYGERVLVKGPVNRFLASKSIPVAPQPPYSTDLSSCDFLLFPKLKTSKGRHFGTLENIQTTVTDHLKAIPISEFHQCSEEWKKRLQRCVASEGSYFEGDNVVELEILTCKIPPSISKQLSQYDMGIGKWRGGGVAQLQLRY